MARMNLKARRCSALINTPAMAPPHNADIREESGHFQSYKFYLSHGTASQLDNKFGRPSAEIPQPREKIERAQAFEHPLHILDRPKPPNSRFDYDLSTYRSDTYYSPHFDELDAPEE